MTLSLRARIRRLAAHFPPNFWLAMLVAVDGYIFLRPFLTKVLARGAELWLSLDSWRDLIEAIGLIELPRLVLGVGLQVMAIGLLLKARIAWAFSLVLLIALGAYAFVAEHGRLLVALYTLVLALGLVLYWRRFDRSSIAAGSLFALTSIVSLLIYAVFGSLYLGDEFDPPIHDLASALYFSIVSMSTVGYGDITPQTSTTRLFSASIIILGITVFATSVSAIAGPVIGGNLKRLVKGRLSTAMRKNHIIIAGATPLAQGVWESLTRRGIDVTVIVPPGVPHDYPESADLLIADPSSADVLREAGAPKARFVAALRDDDADNAFIVLAAKEVAGPDTRTVAMVNASKHLQKIKRVQPDIVFSLQLLGGELLSRTLSGEPVDGDLVTRLFLAKVD